jgi:hypothetical protein
MIQAGAQNVKLLKFHLDCIFCKKIYKEEEEEEVTCSHLLSHRSTETVASAQRVY